MKKCHEAALWLTVCAVAAAFSQGAVGAQLTHTITFSPDDMIVDQLHGYDKVSLAGCEPMEAVGEPRLPCRLIHLAVPRTAQVTHVEVVGAETVELPGTFRVYPAQPQLPISQIGHDLPPFVEPDPAVYQSTELYPERPAEYSRTGTLGGQRIVSIKVYPVRYRPAAGKLVFSRTMVLKVQYSLDGKPPEPVSRRSVRAQRIYDDILEGLVENYGDIDSQVPLALTDGGTFEYLIITDGPYVPILEPLAQWKTCKGWRTEIRTVDWITSTYSGYDNPEKIRNYLKTVYADSGVVWVLLGGDTQVVPCRHAVVKAYFDGYIYDETGPCDLYYSDLDGTWDFNGNHAYGELEDFVDMYPDVFVGRAPITNTTKAQTLVDKVLDYELDPPLDYQDRMVFLAAYLWSGCSGHISKDSIDVWYVPPRFDPITKLYEAWGCEDYDTVMAELNRGALFCNHSGHGSSDYLQIGSGGLSNADFDHLTNGDRQGVFYTLGCHTASLDHDCIAEHWVNNPNGGGIAYVGNSRYGFGEPFDPGMGVSEIYDQEFFASVFRDGVYRSAAITADHKAHFVPHCGHLYGGFRWCQFVLNHLGEPELPIWTDIPEPLTVVHPDSTVVGSVPFTVYVELKGTPLDGGLVCLMKGGEAYEAAFTGEDGRVTLRPALSSPGTMGITVTGHNGLAYRGSVSVVDMEGPYLVCQSYVIDDDASGGSSGNGDGTVDAGETVELPVTLENVGLLGATGVTATLGAYGDPYVDVIDTYEAYGDIGAGETAQSLEDYDFQVSPLSPDGHAIRFVLDITAGEGSWRDESMVIRVQAPVIHYERCVIDDGDGGNGNGAPEPGETVDIQVTIEDVGSGEAGGVTGVLSTSDPYIDVVQATSGYGDIPSGGSAPSDVPYQVFIHDDCPQPYTADLVLTIQTANGQEFIETFGIPIAVTGFTDDMESGENEWVHYVVTDWYRDQWHREDYRSYSGSWSWKCGRPDDGNYADWLDAALVTPLIVLEPRSELRFWHWIDAETESGSQAGDGGIVEISTDMGATWIQIEPDGGYPYEIRDNGGSPFPDGTMCFSGEHDWKEASFDLSAYSGAVRIRFRFGSNEYLIEEGWYIDDVFVGVPPPDVSVTVEPDSTEIPRGGKLGFTATLTNNTLETQGFVFWTEVILPNGKPYPKNPVLGPQWITLAPEEEKSKHINHRIPNVAPLGTYTYTAKLGVYPEPTEDSDAFQFTVVE